MKRDEIFIVIYVVSLILIYFGYIAVFLGVFQTVPTLTKYLNIGIQVFLCLFLMIRFHPFRDNFVIKRIDNMFIFGSAYILFTNLVLVELVKIPIVGNYINTIFKQFGHNTNTQVLHLSVSNTDK
jgi:hypothetical protein